MSGHYRQVFIDTASQSDCRIGNCDITSLRMSKSKQPTAQKLFLDFSEGFVVSALLD